jgi:hypothetical protein
VDERRSWPLAQVLAELEKGYGSAADAVTAAQGKLDVLALGEWVHGGDVREALGEPGPYGERGRGGRPAAAAGRPQPLPSSTVPSRRQLPPASLWPSPVAPNVVGIASALLPDT